MMEVAVKQMPLQSIIYKQNKRLTLSANDSRRPINQAVFAPFTIDMRVGTAYLHCIKVSKNIEPPKGSDGKPVDGGGTPSTGGGGGGGVTPPAPTDTAIQGLSIKNGAAAGSLVIAETTAGTVNADLI